MEDENEEKPRSPLQKKLGEAIAKATLRIDPALLELKQLYGTMTEDERQLLKDWIDQVVPLVRSPVSNLIGRLRVDLTYPLGEENIAVTGVPALAIKKALEHWERGEHYNPASFDEIGIG